MRAAASGATARRVLMRIELYARTSTFGNSNRLEISRGGWGPGAVQTADERFNHTAVRPKWAAPETSHPFEDTNRVSDGRTAKRSHAICGACRLAGRRLVASGGGQGGGCPPRRADFHLPAHGRDADQARRTRPGRGRDAGAPCALNRTTSSSARRSGCSGTLSASTPKSTLAGRRRNWPPSGRRKPSADPTAAPSPLPASRTDPIGLLGGIAAQQALHALRQLAQKGPRALHTGR